MHSIILKNKIKEKNTLMNTATYGPGASRYLFSAKGTGALCRDAVTKHILRIGARIFHVDPSNPSDLRQDSDKV